VIEELNDLGWFLIAVIGLAVLQRRLHFEIQAVLFLLTKRIDLSMTIFAILFLPGVLIHELSHYGMARLLNVPVGKLSLIPQPLPDGRMRLGYVETQSTDFIRDALIGAAPLIVGSFVVAYAGLINLQFTIFWAEFTMSDLSLAISDLSGIFNQQDFWIWFYIIFVVSSTMFPSTTDRRGWAPILLTLGVLVSLILISGLGPWFWERIGSYLLDLVRLLSMIFLVSALVHLLLLLPVWAIRFSLSRIFRLKVI
jgi:hypothetical protein